MDETNWVTLRHEGIDGTQRVHDHPDVIAAQQARGWTVVDDEPEPTVFVPSTAGFVPDEDGWVELTHPLLPAGVNRVPNDPAAIQAALDAGWVIPSPVKDPGPPVVKRRKETPAADAGTNESAGDGTNEE